MKLTFEIWRQAAKDQNGAFKKYSLSDLSPDMSLFEALDTLNDDLLAKGEDPVEFDHDCREGICGQCGLWINGEAHGPGKHTTSCQLYLRNFKSGDTVTIEPFRAQSFPIRKDLKIDRSPFDRIISAGGYISVNTGQSPDANSIPVKVSDAENSLDAASCIGCGACVAACKNASAMLFTAAKVTHLSLLPQGQLESKERVVKMVDQMDKEGFGACTLTGACSAVCPQEISITSIATLNREYRKSIFSSP